MKNTYSCSPLPYAYDALEPYFDKQTMELHHSKHHQLYTDRMNALLEKYPAVSQLPVEKFLSGIKTLEMEEADRRALRNNAGGYLNHKLFWEILGPEKAVDHDLVAQIDATFGSVDEFQKLFTQVSMNHFGSGWTWLVRNLEGKLEVYSLINQDSPYSQGHTPILCLDLWEHAYYLKYQNRKIEYIQAFWQVMKKI